jgi:hypothetical protein
LASFLTTALPDGGFLRQICIILVDLKVVWQAKNISGGLPISAGFLADLTNSAWFVFVWRILAVWKSLLERKKNLFLNISCLKKLVDKK